jgi:hypothetical protein
MSAIAMPMTSSAHSQWSPGARPSPASASACCSRRPLGLGSCWCAAAGSRRCPHAGGTRARFHRARGCRCAAPDTPPNTPPAAGASSARRVGPDDVAVAARRRPPARPRLACVWAALRAAGALCVLRSLRPDTVCARCGPVGHLRAHARHWRERSTAALRPAGRCAPGGRSRPSCVVRYRRPKAATSSALGTGIASGGLIAPSFPTSLPHGRKSCLIVLSQCSGNTSTTRLRPSHPPSSPRVRAKRIWT